MSERSAPEDFDYLFEEVRDASSADAPGSDMHFDAFDTTTWYFEPAPPRWYRTMQTGSLIAAATVAAVALVVSATLLMFRAPAPTAVEEITSVTQTAASTAPSRPPSRTSAPPPAPPPPPGETSAAPPAPAAPVQTVQPRSPAPKTTRKPEIGVTRTPATRSPISVAPQRPGGSQR